MVDYSKWDRMDFSDSDNDKDAESHHAPRVTSLSSPGRVTIGTDGSVEIGQSALPPNNSRVTADVSSVSKSEKAHDLHLSTEENAKKKQRLLQWQTNLTHNGGQHHTTIQTEENTEITLPIYWSQDRYAITFRLGFPPLLFPSKSIRVRVTGALNYKDRFSAVGSGAMSGYKAGDGQDDSAFGAIEIVSLATDKSETLLLSGKLPRPVYLNQGEDEIGFDIEDNIAADIESNNTKFVTIVLPKAVPMEGMIIWWERPLLGFPTIDVSLINDRNNSMERVMSVEEYNASMDRKQSAKTKGESSKKEAFAKAWRDAHEKFREKVKTREPQDINVDD
ncbi:hypothetical protein HJC23_012957 [Cyclotella cryptica]|uniref:CS domain-containing protein n=1 Tax=Cyclotella cryptica TaxID=29204 RepID=A0ABD3Q2N5_9STRA|eukprot:CCRYP_009316-RA/>CCRYP_009316-RA protein AED:0.28 eAED:0.28 QI:0/-1/0/1/-1/1/1/0/333